MKTSAFLAVGFLALFGLTESCTNQTTAPCGQPQQVTADSECYTGNGLRLTASQYGDAPLSFTWDIYALKDTSRIMGFTSKDEKIKMIEGSTFVVHDSLVSKYQRLIVNVAANCGGQLKYSNYYAFVKKTSTSSNCTTWVNQNQ
ncbi:hypothetical protein [Spirosoma aerolatum]|uniref:hypothetical protein n=1 Tax=Spirosoma aerolatum TaxID=1211326 RepID=UPI0009AF112E|nr:hypothetical protein [Spirosoma aerolatum]